MTSIDYLSHHTDPCLTKVTKTTTETKMILYDGQYIMHVA